MIINAPLSETSWKVVNNDNESRKGREGKGGEICSMQCSLF